MKQKDNLVPLPKTIYIPLRIVDLEDVAPFEEQYSKEHFFSPYIVQEFKCPKKILDYLNNKLQLDSLIVSVDKYDPLSPEGWARQPTENFLATFLIKIDLSQEMSEQLQKVEQDKLYPYASNLPQGTVFKLDHIKQFILNSQQPQCSVFIVTQKPEKQPEDHLTILIDENNNFSFLFSNPDRQDSIDKKKLKEECCRLFSLDDTQYEHFYKLTSLRDGALRYEQQNKSYDLVELRKGPKLNALGQALINIAAHHGHIQKNFPENITCLTPETAILLSEGFKQKDSVFSILPQEIVKYIYTLFSEHHILADQLFDIYFSHVNNCSLSNLVKISAQTFTFTLIPQGLNINFAENSEATLKYKALPVGCEHFCELKNNQILIKNSSGKNGVYIATHGEITLCLENQLQRDAFAKVFNIVHKEGKVFLNDKPKKSHSPDQSNKIFIKDSHFFTNNAEVNCIGELFSFIKALERCQDNAFFTMPKGLIMNAMLVLLDIIRGNETLVLDTVQFNVLTQSVPISKLLGKHEVALAVLTNPVYMQQAM